MFTAVKAPTARWFVCDMWPKEEFLFRFKTTAIYLTSIELFNLQTYVQSTMDPICVESVIQIMKYTKSNYQLSIA